MRNESGLLGRLGKKQMLAMLVVLGLGGAGAMAILKMERAPSSAEAGHGHGHGDAGGHGHDDEVGHGHEAGHGAEHGDHADEHANDHADEHADDHGDHSDKPVDGHGEKHAHEHTDRHGDEPADQKEHGHGKGQAGEKPRHPPARAAHGGKLLTDGAAAVEWLMVEQGGMVRLKVWAYQDGQPAAPIDVSAVLARPGGVVDTLGFSDEAGALVSTGTIEAPHVFDATLTVRTAAGPSRYRFAVREGVIAMSGDQIRTAGIGLETAAPAAIRSTLELPGEIRFNEDRTAHVVPRVAGVAEGVPAALGQQVRQGEVLAVISSPVVSELRADLQAARTRLQLARATHEREKQLWEEKISPRQDVLQAETALREAEIAVNNARQKLQAVGAGPGSGSGGNLNRFELKAPFAGTVIEKHIVLGEQVKEDTQVFTIADLSSVWAVISVPARDLAQVRVGETVTIRSSASGQAATGKVAYVGSLIGEQTRTAQARVTVQNPDAVWRPGLFVTVSLTETGAALPVTVSADALQTVGDATVVFLHTAGGFVAQPVQIGRSDGRRVEILKGLQAGARHAGSGSFVVKSEAGKSSATHSH